MGLFSKKKCPPPPHTTAPSTTITTTAPIAPTPTHRILNSGTLELDPYALTPLLTPIEIINAPNATLRILNSQQYQAPITAPNRLLPYYSSEEEQQEPSRRKRLQRKQGKTGEEEKDKEDKEPSGFCSCGPRNTTADAQTGRCKACRRVKEVFTAGRKVGNGIDGLVDLFGWKQGRE